MSHKPISSLSDDSFEGQPCSICGYPSIEVIHISTFPDYIECPQCGSAFILAEDREHILFGKINPGYPETRAATLKQWTVMDAVLKTAIPERPVEESASSGAENADTDEPGQYASDASSLASLWKAEPLPDPRDLIQEDKIVAENKSQPVVDQSQQPPLKSTAPSLERTPVFLPQFNKAQPVPDDTPDSSPIEETTANDIEPDPASGAREPEPGKRQRVVLSGSQIRFPYRVCSHCMTSPASSSLTLTAFLPDADPAQRVPTQIRIPLCTTCRKRASAQSEQEKKARSKAFLYSASSGLLLILLLLLTGLLRESGVNAFLGIFLIIITATVGFSVPLLILLDRTNRIPPPEDAFFVLSTLYLPPSPPQEMTVFDWRSPGYAELFHLANRSLTVKTVHEVEDQGPRLPNTEPQGTGTDESPDGSPLKDASEPVSPTRDDAREDE